MTLDELYHYIDVNPVRGGRRSVFKGTNITPEHILKDIGNGMSRDDILSAHPKLTSNHIDAAILYGQAFPTDAQILKLLLLRLGSGF